jgi:hypothetical protein
MNFTRFKAGEYCQIFLLLGILHSAKLVVCEILLEYVGFAVWGGGGVYSITLRSLRP